MVVKVAELKVRIPGLKRTPNLVERVGGGSASSESEAALPGQSWISDGQWPAVALEVPEPGNRCPVDRC